MFVLALIQFRAAEGSAARKRPSTGTCTACTPGLGIRQWPARHQLRIRHTTFAWPHCCRTSTVSSTCRSTCWQFLVRAVSVVPSARLALHSFFFSLPPKKVSNLSRILLIDFSLLHLSLCSALLCPLPLFYSALCFPRRDKKEKNIFLVCATSFQALSVSQSRPLLGLHC